jgi:hypothetical protein
MQPSCPDMQTSDGVACLRVCVAQLRYFKQQGRQRSAAVAGDTTAHLRAILKRSVRYNFPAHSFATCCRGLKRIPPPAAAGGHVLMKLKKNTDFGFKLYNGSHYGTNGGVARVGVWRVW